MSVAFDVGPLKPNPAGVGIYVRSLAEGLERIGRDDITYVGLRSDAPGLPARPRSIGRDPRLPYPIWVELLGGLAVARSGGEIAHFTDGLVPIVRRARTVVTVLDLSMVREWRAHSWVRYPRIPLVLAAPRLADRVIAISEATADEVMRLTGTSARKIDVIPLAARDAARPADEVVIRAAEARYGLAHGSYLLVPGTIEPRKNHLRVLAAFEDLVARRAVRLDMTLAFAGQRGWSSKRTIQAIDASSVRSRIRHLGYVPDDELMALMTGAAVVVYVSKYEGFGLPVLEAMACGAAVVTSNVSSMPEVAGEAGVLVDPFDPSSIAAGIIEALGADEQTRIRAREQAARFSWTSTAAATAVVYDGLRRA